MEIFNYIKLKTAQFLFKNNSASDLADLWDKGFLLIPDFLSPEECDLVCDIVSPIANGNSKFVISKGEKRVFGVEHRTDQLDLILQKLDSLSGKLISPLTWLKEKHYTYMYNEVNKDNLGSGGGWHRDSAFTPNFKIIVYLSDTGQNNGPFQYIPGSHKIEFYKNYKAQMGFSFAKTRFENDDILRLQSEFEIKEIIGQKGSVLIAITNGLHRGKPVEEGLRLALTRYNFYRRVPKFLSKEIQK